MSNKTRSNNKRKTARRSYVKRLTDPFDRCYYCSEALVWRELLGPEAAIVSVDKRYITLLIDGVGTTFLTATIEHKKRMCDGGTNAIKNLTGACDICNAALNVKEQVRKANRIKSLSQKHAKSLMQNLAM